jgi:hypothetical protein
MSLFSLLRPHPIVKREVPTADKSRRKLKCIPFFNIELQEVYTCLGCRDACEMLEITLKALR